MALEQLTVVVFQLDLVWESPVSNRAKIDDWLKKADVNTDVVFLPEMFTTGFTMNVDGWAESMDGETLLWMKTRSQQYQMAICGSLIIRDSDHFFNRLVFVEPSGEIHFYNKRHLFTMGHENHNFREGSDRLIVSYRGWRICPLICYDLRFPVWSRNRNEYDILVYSADWPRSRAEVWNTLLRARAIENQSYVVGANRVGVDGNSIVYSGNSQLIDPRGHTLSQIEESTEGIVTTAFSYHELVKFRTKFPVLNDADSFLLG